MNSFNRTMQMILSFILAFISLLMVSIFLSESLMSGVITLFVRISNNSRSRLIFILVFTTILFLSLFFLIRSILSARLRKARITHSQMGIIDIGVDAIESIALNAAQSAQAGVKAAKAHITPFKNDKVSVHLSIMAYSNVELPAMMAKVQERVKKDIERYAGIQVAEVIVKVSRVDTIAARVD
ncbi:MAG: alkaline shock response membrane anchor protein AmaP [Clostridiaceae bacterium]|nr:alkaline shock response membrane anchor protein AmaP [Clostridiaceae bacterium]